MHIREYNAEKDAEAVRRILREVGWGLDSQPGWHDAYLGGRRVFVGELEGEAESCVTSAPGLVRHLDDDLPFAGCTAVATSRIARRQGLAKRVLAQVLAADVADGALVAGLEIFDHGFYNQLGYGAGPYEHWVQFDPASLRVGARARVPRRLTADDVELMHNCRLARLRRHGAINFLPPAVTAQMCLWWPTSFGLGYCDGPQGELTHHFWCSTQNVEPGPYYVAWMAYQNRDQFLELLALIKDLSDQVRLFTIREPYGIQLQDLLDRPFKHQQITRGSRFENRINANSTWQMRILDLPGCLDHTHLPAGRARFNLQLTDPIEKLLDEAASWRGVAGEYLVILGPESHAQAGTDPSLPTLTASVGAFTRLWLGVRPATGLAVTDHLSGPPDLLDQLDRTLLLPTPKPDWPF